MEWPYEQERSDLDESDQAPMVVYKGGLVPDLRPDDVTLVVCADQQAITVMADQGGMPARSSTR